MRHSLTLDRKNTFTVNSLVKFLGFLSNINIIDIFVYRPDFNLFVQMYQIRKSFFIVLICVCARVCGLHSYSQISIIDKEIMEIINTI